MKLFSKMLSTLSLLCLFSSHYLQAKSFLKISINNTEIQIPFDHNFTLTSDDILQKIYKIRPDLKFLRKELCLFIVDHKNHNQSQPFLKHYSLKELNFKYHFKNKKPHFILKGKKTFKTKRDRRLREKKRDLFRKKARDSKFLLSNEFNHLYL